MLYRNSLLLLVTAFIVSFLACSQTDTVQNISNKAEFGEYIQAYTSGEISARGEVAITLVHPVEKINQNQKLIHLQPNVGGTTKWVNDQTILFIADELLDHGKEYVVSFDLGKVVDVPEEKQVFRFGFKTIQQDLELQLDELELTTESPNQLQLSGSIFTADETQLVDIKRVLSVAQKGNSDLELNWLPNQARLEYPFQITGIKREQTSSQVEIAWNGVPISASTRGKQVIRITPSTDFELINTRVFTDSNPRVELIFSDLLDINQDLNGLVTIQDMPRLNYLVTKNRLVITPREMKVGVKTVTIYPSIQNAKGKKLGQEITRQIQFNQPKPQIELLGEGVIIPQSKNLLLPFKSVSLGAVDVRVTRIFESNIGQHFQSQNMDEFYTWNMNQVGRLVFGGVIPLSTLGAVEAGSWNTYALDLSKIIEPDPGAMYFVELGFRKHQAVYECEESDTITSNSVTSRTWTLNPEDETEYWKNYDSNRYPYDYNWNERENPCSPSYYTDSRSVQRKVLASDLGLIAKRAGNEKVVVFVTDLNTAKPKNGVEVELFDYQQQSIGKAVSNTDGQVNLDIVREPFYMIATAGKQKGYLKLSDGTALSVSDFDVSGADVQKGVKGFLYGERGVWRPGDSLFVSLILEDKNDVLPKEHPVSFELTNPSGQVVDRQTFHGSLNGMYVYKGVTDKQATTGNWQIRARVGGLNFTKTLKVETVKPNRLKVEMDFADDFISGKDRKLEATLSSRWLHGATARGLKADIELSTSLSAPIFEKYPNFTFSDEAVSFSSTPTQIFDGKLDDNGKASIDYTFNKLKEGPGRIRANMKMRVFEASGSFSVGSATTYYFPFEDLVGIKGPNQDGWSYDNWLDRSETQRFEVATVNNEGKSVANKELEYEIYSIRYRWWWERNNEDLSSYFERSNARRVAKGTVKTANDGKATFDFKLPEDEDGGRYLVRVKDPNGGHSASTVVYFSWYGGRGSGVSPARLSFNSDKEKYTKGEKVTLSIPSSLGSKILVSLETGSKILSTEWLDGKAGTTEYVFQTTKEMSPNVYAHVMHLQPHGQEKNDLPLRMYGVIPIEIENPATILSPQISMATELKPETVASIDVSEQNGKAMTYTIAMVDDGLLDLTNFKTPAPHDLFYAREALGVKTWDLFQYVSDAYAGNLSRILAVGGDGEIAAVDPLTEANRFEPMVRFMGPFALKAGETNHHSITIPNYVGSVRTMVIAGQDGAYGNTETTTPVRKPVMVLATLPRVLGPGESVALPVNVFAMKESVKEVKVRIEANDMFEITGSKTATVNFTQPGDELVLFQLKTKSAIGVGKVRVEVTSGNETAYHEIEIAVRNPNTAFVDVKNAVIDAGKDWNIEFELQGMIGTNSVTLEISRIPPVDFGRRLKYLTQYPYGGLEQTTSTIFTQLFVTDVMDLSEAEKAKIQKNIEAGIKRAESFLTSSGGLSYWPGQEDPNSWGTNYTYHFLLEAQKKGYYVSTSLLNSVNRFQRERARDWKMASDYFRSDLIQAYRLYTLALAKTPDLGAMNRLRESDKISLQAQWRLAAAYALVSQKEAANALIDGLSNKITDYKELSRSYGSATRDRAMILETLTLLDRGDDAALIARDLSEKLSSQQWFSTQTTAYSLIAIFKFLEQFNSSGTIQASYTLNAKKAVELDTKAYVIQSALSMDEKATNMIELKNTSEGTLFARLILQGTPLLGDTISTSNSLKQNVRFVNLVGDVINPDKINQGDDFVAEVTVSNPGLRGDYENVALTQIFPSGWEIRNTRMDDESFSEPTATFNYQDIRDDRVYTYFDLKAGQSKTYRVQLNASFVGTYYLPAVRSAAMYDETISARTPGMWVHVVPVN